MDGGWRAGPQRPALRARGSEIIEESGAPTRLSSKQVRGKAGHSIISCTQQQAHNNNFHHPKPYHLPSCQAPASSLPTNVIPFHQPSNLSPKPFQQTKTRPQSDGTPSPLSFPHQNQ